MSAIFPRLHFEVSYYEGCGLSRPSVPRMQKKFTYVLMPDLVG